MKHGRSLALRVFQALVVLACLAAVSSFYLLPKCSNRQSRNLSFRQAMVDLARDGLNGQSDPATRAEICERVALEQEKRGLGSAQVGCECSLTGCELLFRDRSVCEVFGFYESESSWFVAASTSTKADTRRGR